MNLIVAISQAWYYGSSVHYGRYANQIPGIALKLK